MGICKLAKECSRWSSFASYLFTTTIFFSLTTTPGKMEYKAAHENQVTVCSAMLSPTVLTTNIDISED